MADESPSWTQPIADAASQIATPIGLVGVFAVSLVFFGRGIAACDLSVCWKGCLLLLALLIFAGIVITSLYMAISKPRNLTFDKEAHKAIDVRATVISFDLLDIEPEDEGDDEIDDEWRNLPPK